jgi:predicted Fe-S protein YdhL (DUF1289 family)
MELKEIKEIVNNYEKLYQLATEKIKVIEKLDSEYTTSRGIEDISFYDDVVSVTCDDTCLGCYDTRSFNFPIAWLSKTDAELEEIVAIHRELKAEKERKAKEEKQLKKKKEAEQREFEQYKRLRAKFEQ